MPRWLRSCVQALQTLQALEVVSTEEVGHGLLTALAHARGSSAEAALLELAAHALTSASLTRPLRELEEACLGGCLCGESLCDDARAPQRATAEEGSIIPAAAWDATCQNACTIARVADRAHVLGAVRALAAVLPGDAMLTWSDGLPVPL